MFINCRNQLSDGMVNKAIERKTIFGKLANQHSTISMKTQATVDH